MKKILLTGGTGLLSSEIMFLAVKKGYDVSIINRGNRLISVPASVKIIHADINNVTEVSSRLKTEYFDIIIDFLSRIPADINRIFPVFKNKCKQYVFISSACVYRRSEEDGIISESSPKPNVNWAYNVEKYECENLLIDLTGKNNINYTIIRPYITYGNSRIPFGIAPEYGYHWTLIGRILADKPFFVWDKGEAITTLTHVEDFAKGAVGLLNNEDAYNQDFHVVTKETHTWKEMIECVYKILNKTPDIIEIPTEYIISELPEYKGMLSGDRAIDTRFDNSKILAAVPELRFSISLEAGLRRTINYYKSNNYLKGIDYVYDAKIDRLITQYADKKISYADYMGNKNKKDWFTYWAYRYLPDKIANRFYFFNKKL